MNKTDGGGWIAVNRSILNHWIWTGERYTRGQAWLELIMLAAWRDDTVLYRGRLVHKKRGQVHASLGWLADRWRWNRKTVAAFLDTLVTEGMADVEKGQDGTIITLKNYDVYQQSAGHDSGPVNGPVSGHDSGPVNGPAERLKNERAAEIAASMMDRLADRLADTRTDSTADNE